MQGAAQCVEQHQGHCVLPSANAAALARSNNACTQHNSCPAGAAKLHLCTRPKHAMPLRASKTANAPAPRHAHCLRPLQLPVRVICSWQTARQTPRAPTAACWARWAATPASSSGSQVSCWQGAPSPCHQCAHKQTQQTPFQGNPKLMATSRSVWQLMPVPVPKRTALQALNLQQRNSTACVASYPPRDSTTCPGRRSS